jgi:uncharacterized protein with HEPN domain
MRRERLFLKDILSAADAVAEFIQGQTQERFEGNRMLRSAVVHHLTIIGESVSRVSSEL